MKEVLNFVTENQMLFYIVGLSLFFAGVIVYVLHKLAKKRVSDDIVVHEIKTDSIKNIVNDTEKVNFETEEELDKYNEAVIEELKEEIKNQEEEKSELDLLLEVMEKDLNDDSHDPDVFEREQEENAIISYEELLKASKRESVMSAEEEEKQPIIMSVRALQDMKKQENRAEEIKDEVEDISFELMLDEKEIETSKEKVKKFKNTDFISPIYGKINTNLDYPTIPKMEDNYYKRLEVDEEESREKRIADLEKTLDLDHILDEMQKNEEFLQALKDFRSNL